MLAPPASHAPNALADWLEASVLFGGEDYATMSTAMIRSILEQIDVSDPDDLLSDIRREVRNRKRSSGDGYPVSLTASGYSLKDDWAEFLCYSFLLLVSLNQHYAELRFTDGAATRPAELFEFLSSHAFTSYFGGKVVRFGARRRSPVPQRFSEALMYLASETLEEYGGGGLVASRTQDDGLDLVAWVPFPDGRPGQLVLLGQCAIGTDWKEKRTEVNIDLWRAHVRWLVPPVRAFIVPFNHDNDVEWKRTSSFGGIIFDRARIARLVRMGEVPTQLAQKLSSWCKGRISQLPRWHS